MKLSILSSART